MNETLRRLKNVISYAELQSVKALIVKLDGQDEGTIVNNNESKDKGAGNFARSTAVNGLRLLELAGIVEKRSLGMKGTHIKVLDREALEEVMKF